MGTDPIRRPRLEALVQPAAVVLLLAGRGYGKSTLARQIAGDGAVLDDVHLLDPAGIERLLALIGKATPDRPIVVAGRRLPDGLVARVNDAGTVLLDGSLLGLGADEITSVCTAVLGRPVRPDELADIARETGGWPEAVARAAADIAGGGAPSSGARARTSLIDEILRPLDSETVAAATTLAHLPLLGRGVAGEVVEWSLVRGLVEAGLPISPTPTGWFEIPAPIRADLASRGPLHPDAARRAAHAYRSRGEIAVGLRLVLSGSHADAVAELLTTGRWQDLQRVGYDELRATLGLIPEAALARHPGALLQVARAIQRTDVTTGRTLLIERALSLIGDADPALHRQARAELALDRMRDGHEDEGQALADGVLAEAGPDEIVARGRALMAVGAIGAFRSDPRSLRGAEAALTEAAALFHAAGETEWRAWTLAALGYRVFYARGDLDRAPEALGEALALLSAPTRERAELATFYADSLSYLGRLDEAETALREADELARTLGEPRARAYVAWSWARVASLRGDAAGTIERLQTAEQYPGDWLDHPTGCEFRAEGAEMLARVDEAAVAREWAAMAAAQSVDLGYPEIAWRAAGVIEARYGDPVAAEESLTAYERSREQRPRERWMTLLARAYAARRRADPEAEPLARRAAEAAAGLGHPELPALHEPAMAQEFVPVFPGGAPDVVLADAASLYAITLLGGFRVTRAGVPVEPPPGRPARLLRVLAVTNKALAAHAAIEILWPDVDEPTGRLRMRNVLSRLRSAVGDLVIRDGETLTLTDSVEVDATTFEQAAAAAFAADGGRAGLARAALSLYAGELLPEDRYEAWAAAPRERLKRRFLELCDLLADDARERDDLDEVVRSLDRAIEVEPMDEARRLLCAEALLALGRRGGARDHVAEALAQRAELGLPVTPRLARLAEATGVSNAG